MKVPVSIDLTAFDRADAEKVRAWRNDYRVYRWCRQLEPISDVEQLAWYDRQSKDPTVKFYGVRLRVGDGSELIGVAGLTSICWVNRRAEFSLYIDPARQRQGLGRQALRVLLNHAFTNLGLEQVWGEVFDQNPAIKLFAELGFKVDGRRRAFYYKDSKSWDAYLISILRSEWNDLNRRADSDLSTGERSPPASDPVPNDAPPPGDEDRRGNEGREEPGSEPGTLDAVWDGRAAAEKAAG